MDTPQESTEEHLRTLVSLLSQALTHSLPFLPTEDSKGGFTHNDAEDVLGEVSAFYKAEWEAERPAGRCRGCHKNVAGGDNLCPECESFLNALQEHA